MSREYSVLFLGVFWLTLTLHWNSVVTCFSVDGWSSTLMPSARVAGLSSSRMLPYYGGALCYRSFGARQTFHRQATSLGVRMISTVKPSSTAVVDTAGAVPRDVVSRRSDEVLSSLPGSLKTWFDISVPEGRCVGVEVTTNENDCFPQDDFDGTTTIQSDHWLRSAFHPDEVEFGRTLKKTRNSFWLGRLALRIALDFPDYPILKDEYGRPQVKEDFFGSISHKEDKGVAIVSPSVTDDRNSDIVLSGVGIDLEVTSRPGRSSIAKRILTENERQSLGNLPGITVDEEVLLRFSLKEAIYKAAHPVLRQYVGFQEAEVTPYSDGTASCTWLLDTKADRRIANLTAHWEKLVDDEYFLTSASVYTKSPIG